MGHSENENSCQLCKLERLTFEPPPIYCSPCGSRIKQSAPYYIATISESGHYNFCVPCYTECRGDSIFVNTVPLLKSKLKKRRNDDELEEAVSILASFFPGCIHTAMLHFHCILTFLIASLYSGLHVTNVKAGSIRYVLFLMPKGMTKKKMQNLLVIIATFKR